MSLSLQSSPRNGRVFHPDYGREVNYELHDLPEDSDGQVAETISLMKGYVSADRLDPLVQAQALRIAARGGDPILGVFDHVKRSMRFRNDDEIVGKVFSWKPGGMGDVIEILSRPMDTASAVEQGFIPEEDCDGYATYACGLLAALDIPCAFATVGADGAEPDRFSHVYAVAYPKEGQFAGQRVVLDCSHGSHCGWEAPNRYGKFQEWGAYGRFDWFSIAIVGVVGFVLYSLAKGRMAVPKLPSLTVFPRSSKGVL